MNETFFKKLKTSLPSRHLLIQSQQWKHQNNIWNLSRVNFIVNFEQILHIDFKQVNVRSVEACFLLRVTIELL